MHFIIWSLAVLLLATVLYAPSIENPGYACHPNGTITVNNPNASVYTRVIATYNDGSNVHMCSVSGANVIVITHCNTTFKVTVVFSDGTRGNNVKAIRLNCNQMDHVTDFNETLGVTLHVPFNVKQPVTPNYSISAGFFDPVNHTDSPVYMASVGETVNYTFVGPVEFYLRPIACIAYNSPSTGSASRRETLVMNGCSTNETLMSDFHRAVSGDQFTYTATLTVFRFPQSPDLYIECTVKVCKQQEECRIACDEPGRRRRNVAEAYVDLLGNDGSRLAMIGRRLRVINNNLSDEVSHIHVWTWWSVLVSCLVIVRVCWLNH